MREWICEYFGMQFTVRATSLMAAKIEAINHLYNNVSDQIRISFDKIEVKEREQPAEPIGD